MNSTDLPGKMECFTAYIFQKVYVSVACSVPALNVTSLLLAYQVDLLQEMSIL